MKKSRLCLNVLIIAAVMLTADGQTDAAASQKHILTVWFNAGLGNALQRMVLVNLISNALKFTRPVQQAEIEIGSMAVTPG